MSIGEMFVGIELNPSNDDNVSKIIRLFADIINLVNEVQGSRVEASEGSKFVYEQAIASALAAQMMAVKSITFKY